MSKIELEVADIHSAMQPSEAFSLILKEKEGERYVPIIIGMSEARAILVEMNQSPTHRPLTHELFVSLTSEFGCRMVEVNIIKFENGVYFADMLMMRPDNTLFHLDARPSDAIALALKFNVPFYMNAEIFEENYQLDEEIEEADPFMQQPSTNEYTENVSSAYIEEKLSEMSLFELESLLEGAIESEEFELAAKIQEELSKR